MKKPLGIHLRTEVTAGVRQLATTRTHGLLEHYGRNITHMDIEQLVSSCYLQGVEDAFNFVLKREEPAQANDFQI